MKNFGKRIASGIVIAALATTAAQAGSIFLTGHDVDLHDGQNGYDVVILDYLRGVGTGTAIAASNYKVGVIRSIDAINPAGGFVGGVLDGPPLWTGGVTSVDPSQYANAAAFASFLTTIDVLVVASYTGCGGCDLSAGDSALLNAFAPEIKNFFNSGGDIWGNAGDGLSTYYQFLPPTAVATGTSISGSTGFVCTSAGVSIGINCAASGTSNINGFPTHNRFSSFDPAFTVFETRPGAGGTTEVVSIGLRDGAICDDVLCPTVPEPSSIALVGLGALALVASSRRRPANKRGADCITTS